MQTEHDLQVNKAIAKGIFKAYQKGRDAVDDYYKRRKINKHKKNT